MYVVRNEKTSNLTIKEHVTYRSFHRKILQMLESGSSVSQVNRFLKHQVQEYSRENYGLIPRDEAFNKVQGTWNELMAMGFLADISLKVSEAGGQPVAILSLPNSVIMQGQSGQVSNPKFLDLFREEEFESGNLSKLNPLLGNVFFSSPDFVIAVPNQEETGMDVKKMLHEIRADPSSSELYTAVKGKLKADDIKAIVSMKTEYRPDRIYQPCFEAAMIKAIAHLSEQNWKYFMVANKSNESSNKLLEKLSAVHSVAMGMNVRLVDRHFTFTNKGDLETLFEAALE